MKRFTKWLVMLLVISLIALPSTGTLAAAAVEPEPPTEDEIESAISDGVVWLAGQQNLDGSWGYGAQVAKTGFAVVKLEDRAIELGYESPFDPAYQYSANVIAGLAYIFANAHEMGIGPQPAGNPDTNGNGKGVYFGWQKTYETGIAMMAIAASRDPDRLVTTGSQAGRTYKEVLQDAVDYLAFGQNEYPTGRGGWSYQENEQWLWAPKNGKVAMEPVPPREPVPPGEPVWQSRSDNSNTGYAVLGLRYAESYGFKCTVPQFVKDELGVWIQFIQSADGGSGYSDPGWSNLLRTGNLLFEMAFVGDKADTPRVQTAIAYIACHWDDSNWDPGWKGPGFRNGPHLQAAYCLMKGFESLGIDTITVMRSGVPVVVDWFDEMSAAIVGIQNADGSWPADQWDWGDGEGVSKVFYLSTEWALLTLERVVPPLKVVIDIKPGSFPNSINLVSKGVIPVAILTTSTVVGEPLTFDAATVDPATVRFGPAKTKASHWALEDVDNDGDVDMVLHFKTQDTGIKAGDTEATLAGETVDGREFFGTDSVRTVPPR